MWPTCGYMVGVMRGTINGQASLVLAGSTFSHKSKYATIMSLSLDVVLH